MSKDKKAISEYIKKQSDVIAEIIVKGNVVEINTCKDGVKIMSVDKKKVE